MFDTQQKIGLKEGIEGCNKLQRTNRSRCNSVTDSVIINRSVFMFCFCLLSHEIDKPRQVSTVNTQIVIHKRRAYNTV